MLTKVRNALNNLNNSKLFSGLVMIMLNIGSKYITVELSKSQEAYLRNSVARQFLIFSIIWMGTRDVLVSIAMTAAFVILTEHLFNEESNYCIIPPYLRSYEELIDDDNDGIISREEIKKAKRILEKAKRREKRRSHLQMLETFQSNLL